jgi:ribulose-phosphate 3-epimerase
MKKPMIAPSLLAADFSRLFDEVDPLVKAGISYLHYDVMDGHFVPNISFGAPVLHALRKRFSLVHDVHLMIANPAQYFVDFIAAGASMITFHYEVGHDIKTMKAWIDQLHAQGVKAGVSIKPSTPVNVLLPLLDAVDLVLIMSVEPGFGGQSFLPSAIEKIKDLKAMIAQFPQPPLISVDGGINAITGSACVEAGADILVVGSYLFGHSNLKERLASLGHR